jgi:hypothetical protein
MTLNTNGKTVWTYEQMRDEVFPAGIAGLEVDQSIGGELSFEDWLAKSTNTGIYNKVDVVVYIDESGEVVAEGDHGEVEP